MPASERDFNDSTILNCWMLYKSEQFLQALKVDLNACIAGDNFYPFDNLIDPCFYFGLSMSRIGADIRPRLVDIINEIVVKRFKQSVTKATDNLESSLDGYSISANVDISQGKGREEDESTTLKPPLSIAEFTPLAIYCNDVLTAFNEIRLVTALSATYRLRSVLDNCLAQATRAIQKYRKYVMLIR